jgi:hypothetical protein
VQTWDALEPWIEGEREVRAEFSSPGVSPVFLAYYENLVACILDAGGAQASTRIHQQMKLRRVRPRPGRMLSTHDAVVDLSGVPLPQEPDAGIDDLHDEHSS